MERNFRIGDATVRPRAATIERDGTERRVDRLAMGVLVFLAERSGSEASKREILDAVWEGRHVSEEVLSVAVSGLRRPTIHFARSIRDARLPPASSFFRNSGTPGSTTSPDVSSQLPRGSTRMTRGFPDFDTTHRGILFSSAALAFTTFDC